MTRDRRPSEWGMTGDRAKANVALPATMPNYTTPRARTKHPRWGMPQATGCVDSEMEARPDGGARSVSPNPTTPPKASPDPTDPPKGCHEHRPVVPERLDCVRPRHRVLPSSTPR